MMNACACVGTHGDSGPCGRAWGTDTRATQTWQNWANTEAAAYKCRQLLPDPRKLLESLRSCLSPTCHSQSFGSSNLRAQHVTQPPHLEGRGEPGMCTWPSQGAHSGAAAVQALGGSPSTAILSCNHTPFSFLSLEDKGFFLTHSPESCFPCPSTET